MGIVTDALAGELRQRLEARHAWPLGQTESPPYKWMMQRRAAVVRWLGAQREWCMHTEPERTCGESGEYDEAKVTVHADEEKVLDGEPAVYVGSAHLTAMAAMDGVDIVVVDSRSLADRVTLYEGLPRDGVQPHRCRSVSWRGFVVPWLLMSDEEREEQRLPRTAPVVLVHNGTNHFDAAVPAA